MALGPAGSQVSSASPVALFVIDQVGCTSANPSCPSPTAQALITNNGVHGTMGVSLAPSSGCAAPIYSPLLQLPGGETGFSVTFASGGSAAITLGNVPPAAGGTAVPLEASQYTGPANGVVSSSGGSGCSAGPASQQYPNQSGAWDTTSAQLCWKVGASGPVCGRTTFDSGSEDAGVAIGSFPGAAVTTVTNSSGATTQSYIAPGTPIAVSASATATPMWTFDAGTTNGTNRVATSSPASFLLATAGGYFYEAGWVTYDAQHGQLVVTPQA
ncbi:MAG: hypothetical protein R2726_16095 [Acidimicrobiales bacterium]